MCHVDLSLANRPDHGFVGLWNQGATCYLNSVIQTLCWDVDVRNALITGAGGANSALNSELKHLLVQLRMSEQPAVSTKPLTAAFGWKDGQSHEQHDAHELFSLLLDSMDAPTKSMFEAKLKGKKVCILELLLTTAANIVAAVLTAYLLICLFLFVDSILCPSCSNVHSTTTDSSSLSIDIPDPNSASASETEGTAAATGSGGGEHKLVELLQSYFQPEELDADNKWGCSKCGEKVQAVKSVSLETAPKKLVIQLKRFRFDPSTRRRRKLNSSVLFPLELTAQELVNTSNVAASLQSDDANAVYDLTGVVVHTGTAQGGHYRAYCRDTDTATANGNNNSRWVDFNDAVVTVLDDAERDALFWYNGSLESAESATRRDLVYENAYMLHYTRRTEVESAPAPAAIPAELVAQLEAENAEFRQLQQAYEVMKSIVSVNAYAIDSNGAELGKAVSVDLNVSCTWGEATTTIAQALVAQNGGVVPDHSANPGMQRLRKYNSTSKLMTHTYTDKMDCSLSELGFEGGNVDLASARNTLALEIKADESVVFSDFNPNEMRVRCFNWTDLANAGYGSSDSAADIDADNYAFPASVVPAVHVVPGDAEATVGALRGLLATQHGVAAEMINIVRCTNKLVQNLEDDAKTLRSYNISPDDDLVVEVIPTAAAGSAEGEANTTRANFASVAIEKLSQMRRNITLQFNNPLGPQTGGEVEGDASSVYVHSIKASLESTLLEVKQLICAALNACPGSEKVDVGGFHLRRNNTGAPQLKDESKTLEELELVNFSVLHVQVSERASE